MPHRIEAVLDPRASSAASGAARGLEHRRPSARVASGARAASRGRRAASIAPRTMPAPASAPASRRRGSARPARRPSRRTPRRRRSRARCASTTAAAPLGRRTEPPDARAPRSRQAALTSPTSRPEAARCRLVRAVAPRPNRLSSASARIGDRGRRALEPQRGDRAEPVRDAGDAPTGARRAGRCADARDFDTACSGPSPSVGDRDLVGERRAAGSCSSVSGLRHHLERDFGQHRQACRRSRHAACTCRSR